jgi:DNA gyrase subunit B
MYIGGTSERAVRYMIEDVIVEQLGAPEARIDLVQVNLLEGGAMEIELTGKLAEIQPDEFAGEDRRAWREQDRRFWSLAITAALSDRLEAEVVRKGVGSRQTFVAGVPIAPARSTEADGADRLRIQFHPDPCIFKGTPASFLALCGQIRERAMFHPRTLFRLENEVVMRQRRDFLYPNGLASYAEECNFEYLISGNERQLWRFERMEGDERAEAVVFRRPEQSFEFRSFANGRRTEDGGTHVQGFERAVAELSARGDAGPFQLRWPGDDPLAGAWVVLSVTLANPSFSRATKSCLANPEAEGLVYRMFIEGPTSGSDRTR